MGKIIRKSLKISIPQKDTTVFEWLNHQDNMSMAIRRLIHLDVARHGFRDILCVETIPNSLSDVNDNSDLLSIVTDVSPKPKEEVIHNVSSYKFDDEINVSLPKPMPKNLSDSDNNDNDDNDDKDENNDEDTVSDTPITKEVESETKEDDSNDIDESSKSNDMVDSDGFIDPEKLFNGF